MMKVAMLQGPLAFSIEDQEQPKPKPTEVVLRVAACGVCGTPAGAAMFTVLVNSRVQSLVA